MIIAPALAAWAVLLRRKGGWFGFTPLINPLGDPKYRRFYSLLLSSGFAVTWSFLLYTVFTAAASDTMPSSFGYIPNPLGSLSNPNLNQIPPGDYFLGLFVFGYVFIARRQRSIKKAGLRLVFPFILAGLIPAMLSLTSLAQGSGVLPSIIVPVAVVAAGIGVPYYLRAKRWGNWLLTGEIFLLTVSGFLQLVQFEGGYSPIGTALAANAAVLVLGITLGHYEDAASREHYIIDSLDSLGKLKRLSGPILLLSFFGLLYFSYSLFQTGSVPLTPVALGDVLYAFLTSTSVGFAAIFFTALLVWFYLAVIGNKFTQPITYVLLIMFFFLGAFFLAAQQLSGVWVLGSGGATGIAALSLLIFYEPVDQFISKHYVGLPRRLSINYWVGRSKLLHSRYKDVGEIGEGGYARIFKAQDEQSGREVAVKQAIVKADPSTTMTADELKDAKDSAVDKLNLERAILSNCHFPLIVGYVDGFQEGAESTKTDSSGTTYILNQYIIEEFVDGVPFDHLKKLGTNLTEPQIRYYMQRVLLALNYLHQHDILHRDLTAGNVIIERKNNDVKIIDFGLSKKAKGGATTGFRGAGSAFGSGATGVVGTGGYFAPELLGALSSQSGIQIDEKYDVYSAGAIALYLCTLKVPPNLQDLERNSRDPGFTLAHLVESNVQARGFSPELSQIVSKAMAYDQKNRYPTAFDFYAALSGLHGSFIVTDAGEIYRLDRSQAYRVEFMPYSQNKAGEYDYQANVGQVLASPRIFLRNGGKMTGVLGTVDYDSRQGTFKLQTTAGMRFFTSPKSAQGKPLEHDNFFMLRHGLNIFQSYKTTGLIPLISRNYLPDGVFRYFEVN